MAEMDCAEDDNIGKLKELAKEILEKPVQRIDINTFEPEEDLQDGRTRTYKEALERYESLLFYGFFFLP